MKHTRDNLTVREASGSSASVKDGDLANPMPLLEFMDQLGVVMQLPERAPDPAPVAKVSASAPRSTPPLWLPLTAVCVVAAFSLARLAPAPAAHLPSEILGTWTTSAAGYQGKRLVFTSDAVQTLSGTTPITSPQRVVSVDVRRLNDSLAVHVRYDADGGIAELSAAWSRGGREALTLKNPPGVAWHRLSDSLTVEGSTAASVATSGSPAPGTAAGVAGRKAWEH